MSEKTKQLLENLKAIRQKEPEEDQTHTGPIASNLGADRIYGSITGRVYLVNQDGSNYKGKIEKRRITEKGIDGNNFFSHVYETADGRWFDRAGLPCAKPTTLTKQSEEAPIEAEFVDSDNQSMISLNQYNDLKEYWDYQRKIEYNREKCQLACESVIVVQDDLSMDSSDFFEMMWSKMTQEDYEDPPKNWVPKNPDYRIEGEIYSAQIKFYSINTV